MSAPYFLGKDSNFSVHLPLISLCFTSVAEYNVVCKFMFHLKNHDYMESKKLVMRKKKASKPRTENYLEELNRPVTYILDDVKETVITENTYRRFLTRS